MLAIEEQTCMAVSKLT